MSLLVTCDKQGIIILKHCRIYFILNANCVANFDNNADELKLKLET